MRRGAVLVVTLLVPAACVSVPTAPPELQAVALTFKPSPGLAWIYVYRAGGALERMDPAEARTGIAAARMVPSTWPGTPMQEQQ